MDASTVMRVLESMGVEDYVLLHGVDGDLVVMVEDCEQEEHDREFFSVHKAGEDGYNLSLRRW